VSLVSLAICCEEPPCHVGVIWRHYLCCQRKIRIPELLHCYWTILTSLLFLLSLMFLHLDFHWSILVLDWRLLFLLSLMFLHLVSHWFFLVLPVLFFISHRIALPFLLVLMVHLAMFLSSSHKDQTLASNVIEESREFGAILQLTYSDQGSSVVSSATPPDSSEWGRPLSSSLKWGAS
jgi:hypothetical protein